jgi:single-strand DNA-binding protein
MNKCIFLGRLTKDAESKVVNNDTTITNFTLAVNRKFKQENQPTADFLNFVSFGKTAEVIAKYCKKGSQIAVISRVQTRSWEDNEGKKHYVTEFVVEEFDFAEGKKTEETANNNSAGFTPTEEEDDLPFK